MKSKLMKGKSFKWYAIAILFLSSLAGNDILANDYTNVNFTTIGGSTNGWAQSGFHGSQNVPGLSLFFLSIRPNGIGSFEVHDATGLNEPGVSGYNPASEGFFRITGFSAEFNISQFDVYNPNLNGANITVRGWSEGSTHPPADGTPFVEQTFTLTPGAWSTINLTGFLNLKNLTIDFEDGTILLFNQFHVSKAKSDQAAVTGALASETITLDNTTTVTASGAAVRGYTNSVKMVVRERLLSAEAAHPGRSLPLRPVRQL